MNRDESYDAKLHEELGELRTALRALRAPELDAERLRTVFEERRQARVAPAAATDGGAARGVRWRAPLAAAAGVAAAVLAVLLGLPRHGAVPPAGDAPPAITQDAPAAADPRAMAGAAFQPLMYSPGFSPSGSYSVLRVRIPLSSLAPAQGAGVDGSIEADLLVGEDGLARGIRFDSADTLFVSTASR